MSLCYQGSRTLSLCLFMLGTVAAVAMEQAPPAKTTGLLRSELALGGQTAFLEYPPDLKATDPAHKALLSAGGGAATPRVRVGQLETTGSLRIGTLDLRRPETAAVASREPAATDRPTAPPSGPVAVRYGLWLMGADSGWQLQITDAANLTVGQVPLARQAVALPSPTFVAALIPEDITLGHLVIQWGGYQATADVQFTNPLRRRVEENRLPNATTNRTHDEDTSVLSRARLLAQRNETAYVLPGGQRLSISFERTFAKNDRSPAARNRRGLGVDGPDFARLTTTPSGEVVMLTESSVPRLRIEMPLRFGTALIATGNQVVGFPGSDGLWLKRAGNEWRLVFNNEPDAWGSQHTTKFDAAEISLTHTEGHSAERPFAIALLPKAVDRGRLVIIWGPHEWTADFVVAS